MDKLQSQFVKNLNPIGPRGVDALEHDLEQPAIGRLIRRYFFVFGAMVGLGLLVGFLAAVLDAPVYKGRILLEVNAINEAYVRKSLDPLAGNMDSNAVNVATQIRLLQAGPVVTRVWRELAEEAPTATAPPDRFASLRHRILKTPDARIAQLRAAGMALDNFDARPISGTRLIELSSESYYPQTVAEFLNRVAGEFINESDRGQSQGSERTTEWLTSQLTETKINLDNAEARQQALMERYGPDFATEGTTLHDAELKQLQSDLAAAQADRLSKQARYEAATKGTTDNLPEIMDDPVLRDVNRKLGELRDRRNPLERVLTPNHYKMRQFAADEQELLATHRARTDLIIGRMKKELDAAEHKQKLLSDAYNEKGDLVISQAVQVSRYKALAREVEALQKTYDSLAERLNQSGASSALPVGLIRLVEKCVPPSVPYKPRPATTMGMGGLGGFVLAAIFAFLREKNDKSIWSPGTARGILDIPELGVIPEAGRLTASTMNMANPLFSAVQTALLPPNKGPERLTWRGSRGMDERRAGLIVESFRFVLASLIREMERTRSRVVMVTSAESGDGKTTVVANLGVALAESGKRVVVVDADLRRPHMGRIFDVRGGPELARLLQDIRFVEDYKSCDLASPTAAEGLFVIPSGEFSGTITSLLYSPRFGQLMKRLRMEFEYVLVDVSPVIYLADARIIGRHVDGAALVIRSGHTQRDMATEAARRLVDDGIPILGTILNHWAPNRKYKQQYDSYAADPAV